MQPLNNINSWLPVLSSTYQANFINPTTYKPLDPITVQVQNKIILAGALSNSAESWWYMGAWVSAQLNISPSGQAPFYNFVQTKSTQKVPLAKLALFEFDTYNLPTYNLLFTFPYWLQDVTLEVWQYTGTFNSEVGVPQDIQNKIINIDRKLDELGSWNR